MLSLPLKTTQQQREGEFLTPLPPSFFSLVHQYTMCCSWSHCQLYLTIYGLMQLLEIQFRNESNILPTSHLTVIHQQDGFKNYFSQQDMCQYMHTADLLMNLQVKEASTWKELHHNYKPTSIHFNLEKIYDLHELSASFQLCIIYTVFSLICTYVW